MKHNEVAKSLESFGLSRNEARVYLELLQLGASNAGPLVKNTGLHRQFVYGALDRLVDMQLVTFVLRNNRKVFQAASPLKILELQQERERAARELVPQLLQLESASQDRLSVQVVYGRKEFCRSLISCCESAAREDKVMRIIGGASGEYFYNAVGDFYGVYSETTQRLGVKKYLIAPADVSAKFKSTFAREPGNILKLQAAGLSSPTYTRITPEIVTIEIYSPEPMVIQIWNRAVARGYLEHFELLWSKAEVVSPE